MVDKENKDGILLNSYRSAHSPQKRVDHTVFAWRTSMDRLKRRDGQNAPSRDIRAWLDSPEGQQRITETIETGVKMSERFHEACKLDPKSLKEPFTL
ncbi:MAG: hypothetical protein ACYC7E_16070 [Armatimonadota bacterium]